MSIWPELQGKGLVQHGCLLQQGEVKQSSFPVEMKKHLAVAKQSLLYIFKNVAKNAKGYDEAHMEVGHFHFSGYLLKKDVILVCFCRSDSNQQHLRKYIEDNREHILALL
ncbi:hypothetical protein [Neptuniibacter caesariensis]|uniref:Uncharacterized protein n=1 Tax=Neptuniibacter caesariensis TaxID=207954 RepID=A0A7U8C7V2_NEPCE|nr:hypothetical protein [Neptuniibacter caesariensis]EAR61459.1 hypothetical protein MED92_18173 [Oceanospirillum sp. MED92] [Neptuniibacter caesariensis]